MDFDQLKTFLEVARLGSFSRAAEKVLRSQPAVSTQIRQLEQEYGSKLFDRSAKSVRLTPAGEVVLDYAKQMLALHAKSLHSGSDLRGIPSGTLSLGANEGTFLYVLPKVLAKYHRKFPQVKISVYRSFSHKVSEKVEQGAIDLGVVSMPVKSPQLKAVPVFHGATIRFASRNAQISDSVRRERASTSFSWVSMKRRASVTRELGDPFRRDALKKPKRLLKKYEAYSVA